MAFEEKNEIVVALCFKIWQWWKFGFWRWCTERFSRLSQFARNLKINKSYQLFWTCQIIAVKWPTRRFSFGLEKLAIMNWDLPSSPQVMKASLRQNHLDNAKSMQNWVANTGILTFQTNIERSKKRFGDGNLMFSFELNWILIFINGISLLINVWRCFRDALRVLISIRQSESLILK